MSFGSVPPASETLAELDELLERFDHCRKYFAASSADLPPHCLRISCASSLKSASDRSKGALGRVVISTMIHGNEFGPLRSLVNFIERVRSCDESLTGLADEFVFILGHPEAGRQSKRFLEQDLGRMFHSQAPESLEKRRAQELMPILSTCDLLLDLHQTIEPCKHAFFIFAFDPRSVAWAQLLSGGVSEILVTRKPGASFAAGQMCPDEYVRSFEKPALTIELGQKGFSAETDRLTTRILQNLLGVLRRGGARISELGAAASPSLEHGAKKAAPSNENLRPYQIIRKFPFDGPSCVLNAGFKNFDQVVRGQTLGSEHSGKPIICLEDGYLLFPKYPERDAAGQAKGALPSDIALVLQELEWNGAGEPAWLA